MRGEFKKGMESVGYLYGLHETPSAAHLRLDARGAVVLVILPAERSVEEVLSRSMNPGHFQIPPTLQFLDADGHLVLSDCYLETSRSSKRGDTYQIRARRIIDATDDCLGYAEIDGMTTELDGLSLWSGSSSVTLTATNNSDTLVLRAEAQECIAVGDPIAATVEPLFTFNLSRDGTTYRITDISKLRTRSAALCVWEDHGYVHWMLQALLCLVFGRPLRSRIAAVKREDGQVNLGGGAKELNWRNVYEPQFGRTIDEMRPLDRGKDHPLFYLREVDPTALAEWLKAPEPDASDRDASVRLPRATRIAAGTLFDHGVVIESVIGQIGTALEALGYALVPEEDLPGPNDRPISFRDLLDRVIHGVGVTDRQFFGGLGRTEWRDAFNRAFKGKHADNPLPETLDTYHLAVQGFNLIRMWHGTFLGVDKGRLLERIGDTVPAII